MPSAPNLIERDLATIRAEIKADYESRTGRTLAPTDVENLLLETYAYREYLTREAIQYAGIQNLVNYAAAPMLDELGQLLGVVRQGAIAATTTIRFQIVTGHGGVIIPSGTRISSVDGTAVFMTRTSVTVPIGTDTVDVVCVSQSAGSAASGYAIGRVTNILDPQPFLSSASNIDATAGGADQETDESLRIRIKLAPASFSNAGSTGAYQFHARSANPNIIDVAVISPAPGQVQIFPLMADGSITPAQILAAVDAACNDERVRPLTDTVTVTAPTRLTYSLVVDLVIFNTADPAVVDAAARAALQAFADAKRLQLGQDIIDSQVIAAAQVAGVYRATLPGFTNIIVSPTQFPFCTLIDVNITGTTAG
jgi:phage-related baseplate assembly protein